MFYTFFLRSFLPNPDKKNLFRKTSSAIIDRYTNMSKQYLKTITTWSITLLAMNVMYLAFSFFHFETNSAGELLESEQGSCIAIGIMLHYSLLSIFCFTFAITFSQFLIFYKSFVVYSNIHLKSIAFSYGKIQKFFFILNLNIIAVGFKQVCL
jgi:hypothetical protein